MNKLHIALSNIYVRVMLLSALVIVGLSWYRVYMAKTWIVDDHGVSGEGAIFIFSAFIPALFTFVFCCYRLWKENATALPSIRWIAYLMTFIFSFMLPMLSNDIFSYLTFGDTSNKGIDVFTNVSALHLSAYYAYVSHFYKAIPCVYGPVALSLFKLSAWIGGEHILHAWIAYKLINIVSAVIFIEVAFKIRQQLNASPRQLLWVLFNPVFLIHGVGQIHTDLIAMTFTICAIYFLLSNKWVLAFVFVAFAMAVKSNYVLILPFISIGLFFQTRNWATYAVRVAIGLAALLITMIVLYWPFYSSPSTIITPFLYQFTQTPTKSIAQVLGEIMCAVYNLFFQTKDELSRSLNDPSMLPPHQLLMWNIAAKLSQLVALFTSAYILYRFFKGEKNRVVWLRVYVRLLFLFLLFFTHIFYCWYLMMVLPFMFMDESDTIMKWLFVLFFFVDLPDIALAINRSSPMFFIAIITTYLSVVVYVIGFKWFFIKPVTEQQ